MKKTFKTKKIIFWIITFILILTSLLIGINKTQLTNNAFEIQLNTSDFNKDYSSQPVDLIKIDNGDTLENNDITTSLMLSDNRVFMGGKDGNWTIQTFIDGKASGDPMIGKIDGHGNISVAIKEFDYKTNSKIIIGFSTGFYSVLDTTSGQEIYSFNKGNSNPSNSLNRKIFNIIYAGKGPSGHERYFFFTENGIVSEREIDTDSEISQKNITLDDEYITSFDKNDNIFGTSKGRVLRFNVRTGRTTIQFDAGNNLPITSISDNGLNYFLTQTDGSWANILLVEGQDTKIISSGKWGQKKSILTSIKINDSNNSEFMVAGESGFWAIIDFDPKAQDDSVVSSGFTSSLKDINTIINIGGNDQSMFLFGEGGGKWNTVQPTGNIIDFNKNYLPEEVSAHDGELIYKISTKSDYPNWPLNVKKYKIKSTLHDEKNNKDIVNTSETFDTFGEKNIKIDSLLNGNEYSNLRVQLVEDNTGETPIGSEWITGVNFKIAIGKVSDITDASIGDVNSNGFKLTIDSFDCSKGDPLKVLPYTLDVFATVDGETEESVIWTSLLQTTAIDGESFIIDTLNPGVKYTNISVQINYNGEYVGKKLKLTDSLTTKNIPLSLSGTFSDFTKEGFKILANIDAEDSTKQITDGYYMHITNDDDLDFTSKKRYESGDNIEFVVDGLNPGERYNVKIWLSWDEKGNEPIPNCSAIVGWATIENHVKKISDASVDDKLTTSNSITINSTVIADSDSFNTTTPFTIKVFNVKNDSSKDLLYETIPLSQSGSLSPIIVSNLTFKTSYNIELQLLENGVEKGDSFEIGEVTTHSSRVTNINKIDVEEDTITSKGFDVVLNIDSEYGEIEVDTYEIRLYIGDIGEGEEPIWTSEKRSKAGVQTFTVDKLDSSREYTDTTYVLWDISSDQEVDRVFGPSVTTLSIVTSIDNENVNISNIKDTNFDVEMNVNDQFGNDEPHRVEDYWIWVFANGNDTDPIWKSSIPYKLSGPATFNVNNLDTNTNFNNIKIGLATIEGDDKEPLIHGEVQETKFSIKTKVSHKLIEEITIGLSLFIILLVIIIYFSVVFYIKAKRNRQEKFTQTMKFNAF